MDISQFSSKPNFLYVVFLCSLKFGLLSICDFRFQVFEQRICVSACPCFLKVCLHTKTSLIVGVLFLYHRCEYGGLYSN